MVDAGDVLRVLGRLLADARHAGAPVVHVQHDGPAGAVDGAGNRGLADPPRARAGTGRAGGPEEELSAFDGTDLATMLESLGVGRLIVAGMQSELCVKRDLPRGMRERGYDRRARRRRPRHVRRRTAARRPTWRAGMNAALEPVARVIPAPRIFWATRACGARAGAERAPRSLTRTIDVHSCKILRANAGRRGSSEAGDSHLER